MLAVLGEPHQRNTTGLPGAGAGQLAYVADATSKLSKLTEVYAVVVLDPVTEAQCATRERCA